MIANASAVPYDPRCAPAHWHPCSCGSGFATAIDACPKCACKRGNCTERALCGGPYCELHQWQAQHEGEDRADRHLRDALMDLDHGLLTLAAQAAMPYLRALSSIDRALAVLAAVGEASADERKMGNFRWASPDRITALTIGASEEKPQGIVGRHGDYFDRCYESLDMDCEPDLLGAAARAIRLCDGDQNVLERIPAQEAQVIRDAGFNDHIRAALIKAGVAT